MKPAEAAAILGVDGAADRTAVRQAYRRLIRVHHPDRAGAGSARRAAAITEAFRVLSDHLDAGGTVPTAPPPPAPTSGPPWREPRPDPTPGAPLVGAPPVHRTEHDALVVDAPADEAFRWLLEAAHDIGEVTYLDRSMPIVEVLCRFEDEPATSLVLTLQGRGLGTEVFCTVESIESRPAPPTGAVVDLLELALHRRRDPSW